MYALTKGIVTTLVVGAALLLATPQQAEARRWVYYYPAAPVAPAYTAYYPAYPPVYPVYPGRAAYRTYYYSPGYVVPTYPAPYYYGY